ncbi:LAMMER dual specificity kinases [Moesziomyces antarcticus T-34]|uniref:LAMMER dual specificity kinases n=1 Tax=Pseudozyma antarctica (strain T-34) TaxID=1151754 RepID=M9MGD2_PSEA3|nr:LAMMER dual specificity kinases [Moesziomyces antarcticus T-34]
MIELVHDGAGRLRTAQPETGASQTLSELGVANAEESDVDFVIHAFDSALPYLASIGSEAQWGTTPFSEKPKVKSSFSAYAQRSYDIYSAESGSVTNEKDWKHLVLYEVRTTDGLWTRVAALGVSCDFPDYVPDSLAGEGAKAAGNYAYLNYLISDRRAGDLAKGAAANLIPLAERQARALGKIIFYGDCWRGNNDGLIKYYERLGFQPVGPFEVPDKHGPNLEWTGYLFSKQL